MLFAWCCCLWFACLLLLQDLYEILLPINSFAVQSRVVSYCHKRPCIFDSYTRRKTGVLLYIKQWNETNHKFLHIISVKIGSIVFRSAIKMHIHQKDNFLVPAFCQDDVQGENKSAYHVSCLVALFLVLGRITFQFYYRSACFSVTKMWAWTVFYNRIPNNLGLICRYNMNIILCLCKHTVPYVM